MRLNEKLKSLRASKNMTQENLAGKLGVTRQTISKWEKGISVPDADVLSQIADIFGVSVADLLGGEEKEEEMKEDHVAELLATMNEELAVKNKHRKTIIRIIIIVLIVFLVWNIIPLAYLAFWIWAWSMN